MHTVAQVGAIRVRLIGFAESSQASANVLTRTSASWRDLITLAVPVATGLGFSNIFVNGLLDIDADAAGAVAATSRGDYGNTFSWGGITSVETSSGAPLTDYVLTSGSGFDYSQAAVVPEPSVMQLLLLGALVDAPLAFRRRLC